ncbi:hypothetical protein V2W45_1251195, partial [Cenococcum geophilum]
FLLLPALSLGQILLPFKNSLLCLINPIAAILIGLYRLFNSRNTLYKATLNFTDFTFLPLSIIVTPYNYSGD